MALELLFSVSRVRWDVQTCAIQGTPFRIALLLHNVKVLLVAPTVVFCTLTRCVHSPRGFILALLLIQSSEHQRA